MTLGSHAFPDASPGLAFITPSKPESWQVSYIHRHTDEESWRAFLGLHGQRIEKVQACAKGTKPVRGSLHILVKFSLFGASVLR